MVKLIVALGNPGHEYARTRHNIAWMLIDEMFSNASWKQKFKGEYAQVELGRDKVYLLKPQTYMNLSGESVQPLASFFKINPDEILVIHDEVDLDFGIIHFKNGGGNAGHNGLKSISQCLGTPQFHRLRMGVGRPARGDMASWVLSAFSSEEQISLEQYFSEAAKALGFFTKHGAGKAQNKYNKKQLITLE